MGSPTPDSHFTITRAVHIGLSTSVFSSIKWAITLLAWQGGLQELRLEESWAYIKTSLNEVQLAPTEALNRNHRIFNVHRLSLSCTYTPDQISEIRERHYDK